MAHRDRSGGKFAVRHAVEWRRGQSTFTSINGEQVTIYGHGIYKNESLSMASQVIAQGWVILLFGVPALIISLVYARKKLLWGLFVLAGTIGFFYTPTSPIRSRRCTTAFSCSMCGVFTTILYLLITKIARKFCRSERFDYLCAVV